MKASILITLMAFTLQSQLHAQIEVEHGLDKNFLEYVKYLKPTLITLKNEKNRHLDFKPIESQLGDKKHDNHYFNGVNLWTPVSQNNERLSQTLEIFIMRPKKKSTQGFNSNIGIYFIKEKSFYYLEQPQPTSHLKRIVQEIPQNNSLICYRLEGLNFMMGQRYSVLLRSKNKFDGDTMIAYRLINESHSKANNPSQKGIDLISYKESFRQYLSEDHYFVAHETWNKLLLKKNNVRKKRYVHTPQLTHYNFISVEVPKVTFVNRSKAHYSIVYEDGLAKEVYRISSGSKALIKRVFYNKDNNPSAAFFYRNGKLIGKGYMSYSNNHFPEALLVEALVKEKWLRCYALHGVNKMNEVQWTFREFPSHLTVTPNHSTFLSYFGHNQLSITGHENYQSKHTEIIKWFRPENNQEYIRSPEKYGLKPYYQIPVD